MKGSVKEMSKYYVKGSRIKKTDVEGWFTVDEVCELLNQQDELLGQLGDEVLELKQLLLECSQEFRKYDGRKLFDLDYIVFAGILNKINEVLDPNEKI